MLSVLSLREGRARLSVTLSSLGGIFLNQISHYYRYINFSSCNKFLIQSNVLIS